VPADLARLFEGGDVGRRVEIAGTVQGVEERPRDGMWLLPIAVGGHRLQVELQRRDFPVRPDAWIDAGSAVLAGGATRICVESAILNAPDVAAACREFRHRLPA
jgi:hypothetical protein